VSHRRQPSKVAPEYATLPEIASTPTPGSAFMSWLGRWPPFDRWRLCGQSAAINHEEKQTMTITSTTIAGNLTRDQLALVQRTEDGETRSKVELVADDIGASLRFATVDIHKVQRHSTDDELAGETNPA
jgi:hypothetical protein